MNKSTKQNHDIGGIKKNCRIKIRKPKQQFQTRVIGKITDTRNISADKLTSETFDWKNQERLAEQIMIKINTPWEKTRIMPQQKGESNYAYIIRLQNYAVRCKWSYAELGKRFCEGMLLSAAYIVTLHDSEPLEYLQMRNLLLACDFRPGSAQVILSQIADLRYIKGKGHDLIRELNNLIHALHCARAFENGSLNVMSTDQLELEVTTALLLLPKVILNIHEKTELLLSIVRHSPSLDSQVAQFRAMKQKVATFEEIATFVSSYDGYSTLLTSTSERKELNYGAMNLEAAINSKSLLWCEYHNSNTHQTKDCRARSDDFTMNIESRNSSLSVNQYITEGEKASRTCYECKGAHTIRDCLQRKSRIVMKVSKPEYLRRIAESQGLKKSSISSMIRKSQKQTES